MKHEQIKQLAETFKAFGMTLDVAGNALHSTGSMLHRHECTKWAYIIADLRRDKNTNPAALKAAWNKFKLI